MSTINDGGPAFPVPAEHSENPNFATPGMTLRDYFASAAMQGWMASYDGKSGHPAGTAAGLAHVRELAATQIKERADRLTGEHAGLADAELREQAEKIRIGK